MEMSFCRRCGTPLTQVNGHVYECKNGHTIFANSSPAAGVFIFTDDNNVLLSVRGLEPHKGMLSVFGGFLDGEETAEAAAIRELYEELSLKTDEYQKLTYFTSAVDHYAYKGEQVPVVTAFFWTRLITDRQLTPSDDVAAIKQVSLHKIDLTLFGGEDVSAGVSQLQQLFPA